MDKYDHVSQAYKDNEMNKWNFKTNENGKEKIHKS